MAHNIDANGKRIRKGRVLNPNRISLILTAEMKEFFEHLAKERYTDVQFELFSCLARTVREEKKGSKTKEE